VHNYKNTTTIEQFKQHRQTYSFNCYEGTLKTRTVTVDGKPVEVEVYENTLGDIVHIFLARDPASSPLGSPAGEVYNKPAYEMLRVFMAGIVPPSREPLMSRICQVSYNLLKPYFVNLRDVGVFINDGKSYLRARPKASEKKLRRLDNDLRYDGYTVSLNRSDDFRIQVDVIETKDAMLVIADMPMPSSKVMPDTECLITVDVDAREHMLIFKGKRSLYYRGFADKKFGGDAIVYNRDTSNAKRVERSYGECERKIPIPVDFDDRVEATELAHGQLQVLIPRRVRLETGPHIL